MNYWTFAEHVLLCILIIAVGLHLSRSQFLDAVDQKFSLPMYVTGPAYFPLPHISISDSPRSNHEGDQSGPIEVSGIGIRYNGESSTGQR